MTQVHLVAAAGTAARNGGEFLGVQLGQEPAGEVRAAWHQETVRSAGSGTHSIYIHHALPGTTDEGVAMQQVQAIIARTEVGTGLHNRVVMR